MADELPVIAKCFDLAKEMNERTRKFPRDLRFVLGDRILATTYDVFDALLEAKYSSTKRPMLDRANLLLERLRFQVRLCMLLPGCPETDGRIHKRDRASEYFSYGMAD